MRLPEDWIGVREAADVLGVSERRVQQIAANGDLAFVARGLVDRVSLHHYLATREGARTRAWSSGTAWAAVALLSGVEVDWLGSPQKSRLRAALCDVDANALVSRARNRAGVHRFSGHRSTAARLRNEILVVDQARNLGLVDLTGHVNGYVAVDSLAHLVQRHALNAASRGDFTLRATAFDLDAIAIIANVDGPPVLAAIDSAESLDPRERGVALEALDRALAQFRG